MRPFEYASPKTKEQVVPLLGKSWGEVEVLAGGTDLLSLMKDEITAPHRLVNITSIADLHGITLGPRGRRQLRLERFFFIPKTEQEREHDLKPNELVTEITVPAATEVHAAHYEVRQKEAFDWPYATAAVALTMNGNTVESARVVLGHVAPVPWLSAEAA